MTLGAFLFFVVCTVALVAVMVLGTHRGADSGASDSLPDSRPWWMR